MIQVTNTQRQMQIFNLPHDVFCGKDEECGCTDRTLIFVHELQGEEHGLRAGERMPQPVQKKLAGSVTFLAGETKELPDAFLKVHEVKVAMFHGRLKVAKAAADAEPPPAPPAAPTAAEPAPEATRPRRAPPSPTSGA